MKRILCLLLCLAMVAALVGCGDAKDARIAEWEPSAMHSDREINAAMRAVKRAFTRRYDGCTLTQLSYSERQSSSREITVLAVFDVDATGGADGVLNPNSHYTNYKFTFVRGLFGIWKLADSGYA